MTRRDVAAALFAAGIEEAESEALLLLSHFTGLSRARLLSEPHLSVESDALADAVRRRKAREPLQYILGVAPFLSETYAVSKDCLIPRFDTERLVETAASLLPKGAHIADLCTGSGCVAISLLCRRRDLTADAYDISEAALAIATENAKKNGVLDRISFRKADLLSVNALPARYDAILSNPPYIETRVLLTLSPEVQHEPRIALDGGEDGLIFYRHFTEHFRASLTSGGFFLFEIGYDQGNAIRAIAAENGLSAEVTKDYGGCDRVALLQ